MKLLLYFVFLLSISNSISFVHEANPHLKPIALDDFEVSPSWRNGHHYARFDYIFAPENSWSGFVSFEISVRNGSGFFGKITDGNNKTYKVSKGETRRFSHLKAPVTIATGTSHAHMTTAISDVNIYPEHVNPVYFESMLREAALVGQIFTDVPGIRVDAEVSNRFFENVYDVNCFEYTLVDSAGKRTKVGHANLYFRYSGMTPIRVESTPICVSTDLPEVEESEMDVKINFENVRFSKY